MPDHPDQKPDVDALVRRLRERVEERRRSGEYPADLERDLDRHFEQAVAASLRARRELEVLLDEFREASKVGPERISTASDKRLGARIHGAIGKVVKRQTEGILLQVGELAGTLDALLSAIVEVELADIVSRVDTLMDRIAAFERLPQPSDEVTGDLAARVSQLEAKVVELSGSAPD